MSNYYLSAYSHNRKMKIPIESKHVYDSKGVTDDTDIEQYGATGATGTLAGMGTRVTAKNIELLWQSQSFYLKPGVGADGGLIGDKIMLKSIYQEYIHHLNPMTFHKKIDAVSESDTATINPYVYDSSPADKAIEFYTNPAWRRDFKFMIVHFENDEFLRNSAHVMNNDTITEGIAHWFNTIYVPNVYNETYGPAEDGHTVSMSNKSELKRESTPYNGTFKIIMEKNYTLTAKHNYEVIKFTLQPHKQLNFKPITNDSQGRWAPTDDWYTTTFAFIISPTFYNLDMDPMSAEYYLAASSQVANKESQYEYKIKYKYYDI